MSATAHAPTRYKIDVFAYHRMAEAGIIGPDDRVELMDGEIFAMSPIGQDHEATVDSLNEALVLAFAGQATVSVQNPVRLDNLSEPQPDVTVLRRRADGYRTGPRKSPADTLLLIEVADSSLQSDRAVKLPLYAKAGVPEVWIVDLERRVLECYRQPDGERYREMTTHTPDETVTLSQAPGVSLALRPVFG